MKERLFTLLAATLVCLAGCDRKTDDASSSQGIPHQPPESPTPTPAATVTPSTPPQNAATPAGGKAGKKEENRPTDITAREVRFDARTNIAIFTQFVHLDNPDFRVDCDKLTAYLKSEKKTAGNTKTPAHPASKPTGSSTPAPKGGGLDRAIAESTSERRVIITQDKKDEDGNILVEDYSIGKSDRATYDTNTKETVLTGNPDVTQGLNRCLATDPSTKIYLIQDGPMRTVGPNKSILREESNENAQGPTEITSLESTFDSAKHLAVFTGSVVANNPQFHVVCDKLTGYLKHGVKTSGGGSTDGSNNAVSRTPVPAKANGSAPAEQEGGLEKAVAETTSTRRVLLTQDKKDTDGNVIARNFSVGHADKAIYDAVTKDTVLSGNPDVTQGSNHCVATAPGTIIILNQDNHMKAIGPHTMVIVDQAETKFPGSDLKVPRAVAHAESIVQAVLVTRGTKEPDAPGMAVYTGNSFKVTKVLRGTGGDTITVKIIVLDRDNAHEVPPEPGTEYILYLAPQLGQEQTAIKVVPFNEETLKEVTDALSAPR